MSDEPNLTRNLHRNTRVAGVRADELTNNSAGQLPPPTTPHPSTTGGDVSGLARRRREQDIVKEKREGSRDPREKGFPDNILIFMPPVPDYDKYGPKQLDEDETRERRALISEAVGAPMANTRLPMACSHLKHWLQGTGKFNTFSEKDIPWDNSGLDIEASLHAKGPNNESHVSALAKGIVRRANPAEKDHVPPNTKNVLYYQNSIGLMGDLALALKTDGRRRLPDAFFALGTFTLASELAYHVTSSKATSSSIVIDRWRCQVFDTYDWDITPAGKPLDRQVFFFAPDDVLEEKDFMGRYGKDYVLDTVPSTVMRLAKGLGALTGMTVVAVDVNFFIELETSGAPPRPRWFDVFSNIKDITDWKVDLLDYVRDMLDR